MSETLDQPFCLPHDFRLLLLKMLSYVFMFFLCLHPIPFSTFVVLVLVLYPVIYQLARGCYYCSFYLKNITIIKTKYKQGQELDRLKHRQYRPTQENHYDCEQDKIQEKNDKKEGIPIIIITTIMMGKQWENQTMNKAKFRKRRRKDKNNTIQAR